MSKKTEVKSKAKLQDYAEIVGKSTLEELQVLADKLTGKIVQNVNSTFSGGGVAEILNRMIPLLSQLGVDARWDIIRGTEEFFEVTKKFHNALHGRDENISKNEFELFAEINNKNADEFNTNADIYYIHDPQPIMLINKRKKLGGKWIWRCHIDVSNPDKKVWDFIRQYIVSYDSAVFSSPAFSQVLPVPQFQISPSIDPLSDKNRSISDDLIKSVLNKYGLQTDKPMVVQISRFDYLKDPVGVIEAYKMVKKNIDCQLVLAGGTATDDPESGKVLDEVREKAEGDADIHILPIPPESDLEINALQRAATVIIQKSIKEGFGLTVSEALWKSKPVVASATGGIPLQVKNRFTGLLIHSIEGAAFALKQLLSNPEYASWLGKNGHEHVKRNFLITRHLKDYLILFIYNQNPGDVIYL